MLPFTRQIQVYIKCSTLVSVPGGFCAQIKPLYFPAIRRHSREPGMFLEFVADNSSASFSDSTWWSFPTLYFFEFECCIRDICLFHPEYNFYQIQTSLFINFFFIESLLVVGEVTSRNSRGVRFSFTHCLFSP